MKIDYGQGEKEVFASVWALVVYEQEFDGADMIKDVFGKVALPERNEGETVIADFTTTNWTAIAKALWACLKAADDAIPPFKQWAKDAKEINFHAINDEFIGVLVEGLFHSGGTAA